MIRRTQLDSTDVTATTDVTADPTRARVSLVAALAMVVAMVLAGACGGVGHGESSAETHAADEHGEKSGDDAESEHAAKSGDDAEPEHAAKSGAAKGAKPEHAAKSEAAKGPKSEHAAKDAKAEDAERGTAVKRAAASAGEAQDAAAAIDGTRLKAGAPDREGPETVAEELTVEVRALRDSLTLLSMFLVGALIAVAWFSTQLIQWCIRLGYRLGLQRARWVDNFGMIGRLGIWVWAVTMILLRAWRIAPMITLFAAGLVAAGLMVGFVKHFENLSTGFALALRGRIKIGDQITVGDHTGMVRHIGLMQIHLRTPEGSVYLPNRLLAGEALSIGRSRNSYPLRARLTATRPWPPQALEAARCVAALSPYRDVNSRVNVQSEVDDGRALVVEIQVWSPRLLDAADKHLRTLLEANLRGMVEDLEEPGA